MMKKQLIYIALGGAVLFSSCKKEDEVSEPNPPISDVPAIELVTVSPTTVSQFNDVTFTIKYTDGNGDIGNADADEPVVFVTDLRDNIITEFHVPPLAPEGESIAIEGNLQVVLSNVIILDQNNTSENASFQIYLRDRAGNNSNNITAGVTITQ